MPVWCGTLQFIKFDTIMCARMVWHITVYSLKKIIKNWGTIICACMVRHSNAQQLLITVDSRYLEFDGTMVKIRVNRSSTQEELRRYRKCGLFNNERETTRANFWRAKTSIACPYSRNEFKHIRCFCCCFFLSVKFFESCETTDNF